MLNNKEKAVLLLSYCGFIPLKKQHEVLEKLNIKY